MDLVIYHAGCYDGFCAAWLAHSVWPEARLYPAYHGGSPPAHEDMDVLIVDFSYSRDALTEMARKASSITLLDHHQTAEQELSGLEAEIAEMSDTCPARIEIDQGRSGGRMMWDYLVAAGLKDGERPWLVDYTEDRDLWRHKLPYTRELNALLRSHAMDTVEWDTLCECASYPAGKGLLIAHGDSILRRDRQLVQQHISAARMLQFAGHRVPVVNATVLVSDIGNSLCAGHPFAVCYFDTASGKRVYSLRSDDNGLDVSAIARARGGGGHPHAAGFSIPAPDDGVVPKWLEN